MTTIDTIKFYEHLLTIDGIGEAKAKELIATGIHTMRQLKLKKNASLLSNETLLALKYPIDRPLTWDFVSNVVAALPKYLTPVGSFRRESAYINDVDFVTTTPLAQVAKDIAAITIKNTTDEKENGFKLLGVLSEGISRYSIIASFRGKNIHIDFFYTTEENLPFALLHYTGSKMFNIRIRAHAKSLGLKLNQYGLFRGVQKIKCINEREILKAIGVTFKSPPQRNE